MSLLNTKVLQTPGAMINGGKRVGMYPKRFTLLLFMLFAANTVFPLVDFPLLGLSISAFFFAPVTLEVVFRQHYLGLRTQRSWLILSYIIGFGVLLSILANALLGNLIIDTDSAIALIQAAFWIMVFLITMALVSHLTMTDVHRLVFVIGIAAILVGVLRLYEAVAFARIGSSTSRIFSQNDYGVLFSGFTPYAVVLPFLIPSMRLRFALVVGLLGLVVAIGINGSRSSWVASAVGLIVLYFLFALVRRPRLFSLVVVLGTALLVGGILLATLPASVLEPLSSRFATLERIDDDKSYATRTLMQQKSLILFEENPLFGVGRNQFRNTSVELDFTGTPFGSNPSTNFNLIASHNSYAQLLAENGLVGVVPFAVLLALLLFNGFRAALKLGQSGQVWALAIFAGFVAMSIHLWSIDNLKTTSTWFTYGLMAGMIEYERRQRNPGLR